jgi:hypothetical protein
MTGYYNWRITGNAFCMPHLAYAHAYSQPALLDKLQLLGSFYLGPMLLVPLLLSWRLPRGRNFLPPACCKPCPNNEMMHT